MKLKDLMNEYGEYEVKEGFIELLEKPKPRLSDREYAILNCLDSCLKYIARDQNGNLYVCECKPRKYASIWDSGGSYCCLPFNKSVFRFITWYDQEPASIKELINEYEAINMPKDSHLKRCKASK